MSGEDLTPKLGQNFCQNFCNSMTTEHPKLGQNFCQNFCNLKSQMEHSKLGQNFCQNFCNPITRAHMPNWGKIFVKIFATSKPRWNAPNWGSFWKIKVAASLKSPTISISPVELSSSAEPSSPVESFQLQGSQGSHPVSWIPQWSFSRTGCPSLQYSPVKLYY